MALQFADPGGEYYFSLGVSLSIGIWSDNNADTLTSTAAAGRATTYAILSGGGGNYIGKFLSASYQGLIAGCAFYLSSTVFTANQRIYTFQDAGTTQVDIRTNSTGNLFFTRNGTTIGGTSTNALTSGWHYIEVKVFISTTVGTAEVRVDGVVWLTLTGQNTQATGNASVSRVYILPPVPNFTVYYKDIYILDTVAGQNTTYLGDITVAVVYPNAAGTNQQWTPNTGSQVSCVQDGINHTGTWPDGDTTYINDGTSGDISDFQHQAISVTGTIYGVIHESYCRKDIAGAQSFNQVTVQSGAVTETGPANSLGNSYLYYTDILEQNPTGPATWTASTFNSTNFGAKVT